MTKQPTSMEGSIPPTGEPAIFIEEDKAFIARVSKAKKVAIDVSRKGQAAAHAALRSRRIRSGQVPADAEEVVSADFAKAQKSRTRGCGSSFRAVTVAAAR